ncbi:MAG: GNAT family N-acetyltransferase [Candidatus Hydrogenedens sp.]|nr:GNAT family N-acetyltransferase [Candidatus Hydrogenedens sp.]
MPDLVIHSVRDARELNEAHDLMAKVHTKDYFNGMRLMEQVWRVYPSFRPEDTRVARLKGEIVGALRVTTDTIRLGEARLRMGGFGWVATSGRHRNLGVARALMSDTLEHMRARKLHVSMLFGIPNFYHRFGFSTTLANYRTTLNVADFPKPKTSGFKLRPVKPGDIRAMQRMHEQGDGQTACSIIRCGGHFQYRWGEWTSAQTVMTPDGKVLGYFLPRTGGERLEIDEVGVLNRRVCGTLLDAILAYARDNFLREIEVHAPPHDPFIEYLLQFKSKHAMELTYGEGGMMAVLHLGETLDSMAPEWEYQLAQSALREQHTETTLVIDRVPYRLLAHHGSISVVQQPGKNKLSLTMEEFMHLLTGYRHIEEVLAVRHRILSQESRDLLAVLFAKRTPYVWTMDRF